MASLGETLSSRIAKIDQVDRDIQGLLELKSTIAAEITSLLQNGSGAVAVAAIGHAESPKMEAPKRRGRKPKAESEKVKAPKVKAPKEKVSEAKEEAKERPYNKASAEEVIWRKDNPVGMWIEEQKLTRKQASEKLGTPLASLNALLVGRYAPTPGKLGQLARDMGIAEAVLIKKYNDWMSKKAS